MKKSFLPFLLLCVAGFSSANEQANEYELAVKAFHSGEENEAFIHLKNALTANPEHLSSKLLLAKVYFNANNLGSAEKQLEEALNLGADINLVLPMLGNVLLLQGKTSEVLAFEERASEFSRQTQFEWKLLRGRIYLLNSQADLARKEFEQATKLIPNKPSAMNTLATLYLQQKEYVLAEQWIKRSLSIAENNERTWLLKGNLEANQGQMSAALESYQKAYSLDPEDPKVLRSLVMTHLKANQLEEAKRYLKKVQEQTPNDPTAILISATLLSDEDNAELAEQALTELSQKVSAAEGEELTDVNTLLFIQGASEFILKNDEKAQQYLSQYLRQKPSDLGATRMLAKVYLRSGEPYKLQLLLQENFDYIIRDLGLSVQLVYLYIDAGRLRAAQQAFEQIRAYHSDSNYVVILEAELARASGEAERALSLLQTLPYSEVDAPIKWLQLKGELALQVNNYAQAKLAVEELIGRNIKTSPTQNLIAAYYIKTQQFDLALRYLDDVLASSPRNLGARFNKALVLKSQGNPEQALVLLKQILTTQNDHVASYLLAARIYLQQQDYPQAIEQLDKVLLYQQDNRVARELKLDTYMQTQQWSLALVEVEKLNREYILNEQYLSSYAEVLIRLERYDDAAYPIGLLDSIWKEQPENLITLAQMQIQAKQLSAAKASLLKSHELDPKIMTTLVLLAKVELAQQQIEDAEKTVVKLQQLFGDSSELYALKGDILLRKSLPLDAQKQYSQAVALNHFNREAVVRLYQLSKQGVAVKAFHQQLEALLEDSTKTAWHRRLLADSYLQDKQLSQAQTHYEALRTIPELENEPGILNNLAYIYSKTDLDKAYSTIAIAVEQGSKNAAILDTIGWIEIQRGKFDQGLVFLREAYTMNSSDAAIRYHLAFALNKLGRKAEAKREVQEALELDQQFSEYEDAKALLDSLS
ncbi:MULTISPECIES: tetratricopeptide repeat protein [unclassified Agarivorans]|uniref:tetratricopeptide repeat protein n=1 Tax=unclassified Agarivorans TaxID=2636026 RepID=UPI0026E2F145|nr:MULTISPECIES: tetratricopeptide repeat protein [unclassified Agarivorans]MDO6684419.1 tetratricopeptide repeat protein [Agarivorans sp. 3_MG-2023]MDO6714584.1 tetratricopeptide repeat protein [Agarivorans sp. 2_MG-2023]